MNNLHVGYECAACAETEFIAVETQDFVYSDDAMIALGWTTDNQGNWFCPSCKVGG